MSNMTVKFIGKEYSVPQDVLTYIDLLDFTDGVQKQLASAFVRKLRNEIAKDNIGLLGDEDLAQEIEQQVGKYIAKLCDKGIFTRTINDYLKNNKGYQLYSDVNKAALEKMKSLLIQEMDAWQAGYENAVNKAESHVTGMGFSIWSSSFVNHAIYAAMEASTLNKQSKEAESQYQKDMNDLHSRLESQYGGEKSNYINNTYIPSMEAALTVFAYELLDKYVADLIANGKFDSKTLDYIDIGRSNDLLKNLTLSNNKQAILENAFAACPYNIAVYMQAMKYDLLDYDSFQTAKVFKQDHHVLSFFRESWGEVSYPTKFNINYHCINVWASLTGKSSTDLLRGLTEQYATGIVKAYSRVADIMANKSTCSKIIGDLREDVILSGSSICVGKAREYVEPIVHTATWEQLTERCGHTDLLSRITRNFSSVEEFQSKTDFDRAIIELLAAQFEEARKELGEQIEARRAEEERQRLEQEKQEQERKKKNKKIAAIVTPIITVAIVFVVILNTIILPSVTYKNAVELYNGGEYEAALAVLTTLDGYKDSDTRILDCKYAFAIDLYNRGNYDDAKDILLTIQDYKDANRLIGDCYMQVGDFQSALAAYGTTDIIIPDGISHIKAEAFKGCDNLTSITIPASVTSIGEGAFDDCESLLDVHISDLSKWCQIQFEDLTSSPMHYGDNIYLNGELLTNVVVPNNLTQIKEYTFASWECLVSIQVSDNITDIDSWAFAFCDNLKSVTLPDTITNIKESTFDGCISLTDIIVPKNVADIGESAFYNCDALINIVIPSNVDNIGKSAFAHCNNLTTFSFPDGIKSIERYMFYPGESLQTVKIPNSVNSIGKWAFRECFKLTTIEFNGTIAEWKAINKEYEWDYEIGQYTIYCTDGQISIP